MSILTDFENTVRQFESKQRVIIKAKVDVQEFSEKNVEELKKVLAEFSKEGLLDDIDPNYHFRPSKDTLPPDRIEFRGASIHSANTRDDSRGKEIAEMIAEEAGKKKIPVSHGTEYGHHIKILQNVDRANGPEILLRALATYAESQGKSGLAKSTTKTADEMRDLSADKMKKLGSSLALV